MNTYSVSVKYHWCDSTPFWTKKVEEDEYKLVKDHCEKSAKIVSMNDQLLRPTRTYSIIKLAQDLFLPCFMNVATLSNNVAQRMLFLTFVLVADLATLPIRLFTCIPRILTNQPPSQHPLHRYLTEQKAPVCATAEHVWIELQEQHSNSKIKDTENKDTQDTAYYQRYVNFIETPYYTDAHSMSIGGASGVRVNNCSAS